MSEDLSKYGIDGIIIGALAWFVLFLIKEGKKERKEMREEHEKQRIEDRETRKTQFDQVIKVAEDSTKAVRENTNIVSALKTLFENKNR